ncbi:bifunctional 3,4-dihydroxy-2-butanone-4-phosphate synthase/GTP cyclohydrolase II [Candidatus Peregrinibacteria bacterium]|nr:bifunctional 3,4-dihydroxy-2-butanone-4-phosphate synthase/GTP cyclohydrolase II [Candidatus Peregrinibacteria bacterium]
MDIKSKIESVIKDLRDGKQIIVVDDEDRENEGDLIIAGASVNAAAVNFMASYGKGLICAPISKHIADKINLGPMVFNNKDNYRTNFTVSIDAKKDLKTGISMKERANTIASLTNENVNEDCFVKPGHVFPLIAKEGGVLERAGHTEAAIDLMKMADLPEVAAICEIIRDDGEMARLPELEKFAEKHGLKILKIRDIIKYRNENESLVEFVAETKLPTVFGKFQLKVFKSRIDNKEHIALIKGNIKNDDPVLVRVHSECITSEVFGSKRCDCRSQLEKAMALIEKKGSGVLLYMRQEGRGIGLINKIRAYELQDGGLNTIEANERLGFKADLRDYGIGAQILKQLGLTSIDLLTNNPKKIVGLSGYELKINKRIPLEIKSVKENALYLKVKKEMMGHFLQMS